MKNVNEDIGFNIDEIDLNANNKGAKLRINEKPLDKKDDQQCIGSRKSKKREKKKEKGNVKDLVDREMWELPEKN